jgi:hypothetical protein
MTPRTLWFNRPRGRLACLLALAALAVLMLAPAPGPRVEQVLGRVEIGRGEPPTWRVARQGDPLEPGDVVRTGHDGRAELMLAAGTVRLYGDTLLRLPAVAAQPGKADAVELDQGSSLFDILRRGRDDFQVRTPEVVVSIKGTRFLVVAEQRAEVAVFHGTVGLHRDSGPAHEMLVREGFAAVGGHGLPFELLWSGAPDPWDAWSEGGRPPRAPERSAGATEQTETLVEAAKEAAKQRSRGAAVKQATERHPELASRLEGAIEKKSETGVLGILPAALDPNPIDPPGDGDDDHSGSGSVQENYVEALLTGGSGGGLSFEVNTHGDEVEVTSSAGVSVTLTAPELQSLADGLTQPPAPIANAPGVVQGGLLPVVGALLGLLDH